MERIARAVLFLGRQGLALREARDGSFVTSRDGSFVTSRDVTTPCDVVRTPSFKILATPMTVTQAS